MLQRITDENTLRSVGTAVGIVAQRLAEDQIATNAQVRGAFADLKEFVKNTLGAIDDVIASALGNVAGVFNQYLRERLSPGIGYFLGDVFVYQRHREQIRETLTTALAEHAPGLGADPKTSVSLIAHSLGGAVSFDAAVSDSRPLWIKNFITFGSQSPFFHVLDRRSNTLAAYAGARVVLPPTIQQWTNLWEPMDPLAFVARKYSSWLAAARQATLRFNIPQTPVFRPTQPTGRTQRSQIKSVLRFRRNDPVGLQLTDEAG